MNHTFPIRITSVLAAITVLIHSGVTYGWNIAYTLMLATLIIILIVFLFPAFGMLANHIKDKKD